MNIIMNLIESFDVFLYLATLNLRMPGIERDNLSRVA
jgi:hypothetical protein